MPQAGWYLDPTVKEQLRWWDGTRWSAHTTPSPGLPPQPARPERLSFPYRRRNPLLAAALTLLTAGLYYFFWFYFTTSELAELDEADDHPEVRVTPDLSLLAVSVGSILIVPLLVANFNFARRIERCQERAGVPRVKPLLAVIGLIFVPLTVAYLQANLNSLWNGVGADAAPTHRRSQAPVVLVAIALMGLVIAALIGGTRAAQGPL